MADAAYANGSTGYEQFDIARKRAQQQGLANKQQQGEALQRRFAAIGNLNSGAAIKAQDQSNQAADANTNAAIQDVNSAEQTQKYNENQAQLGRNFQASESQKGRDLQASQFAQNQAFQKTVFADESKFRQIDADQTAMANKQNALTAAGNLSDEQLNAAVGGNVHTSIFGGGGVEKSAAIAAYLKKLGYG